jgi:hypothetical protein
LWHPPGKETRGALTKEISHEEKSSLVQSLEQPDVIRWEPTKLHDMEDCSVVHGVEGIFMHGICHTYTRSSDLSFLTAFKAAINVG